MTFRFIDAVSRLVPNFTPDEFKAIYDKVGGRLHQGQLRKVFVILNDDDRPATRDRAANLSGSNLQTIQTHTRGGRGGRGGRGRGAAVSFSNDDHKRKADSEAVSATPAKSRRGR
jgi:hypothetical protein